MKRLLKRFKRKKANHNKISHGVNRHAFPEFWGVSDEDARRMMQEHSDALDAERYKAEAWDILKGRLEDSSDIPDKENILEAMQEIYKEVEEDNR